MAKAFIDEFGIHVPSYEDVLADLQEAFRGIYGKDVYLEPDSQDGALLAVFALRLSDAYALAVSVYNSFAPSTAQGTGLSSVVKVNGIRRHSASYSQVPLRCIGQAGTIIKDGVATDDAGTRWLLPASVSIPVGGEVTVMATAETAGDFRAAPGEVKNIATPALGWQVVVNPEAAVPGAKVEQDSRLRTRQRVSTALPSRSIFDGTVGAVAGLPGVIRVRGYENDTSEIDANGLPPHSIAIVTQGGEPQAIGDAIAVKKGPGCGTFGATDVNTSDKYGAPLTVNYFIASDLKAAAHIRIKPLAGYLASTGSGIAHNTAEYINGMDIGEDILVSRLYPAICAAEPEAGRRTFDVLEIQLGPAGGALSAANLAVAFNAAVSCLPEDVTVQDY